MLKTTVNFISEFEFEYFIFWGRMSPRKHLHGYGYEFGYGRATWKFLKIKTWVRQGYIY